MKSRFLIAAVGSLAIAISTLTLASPDEEGPRMGRMFESMNLSAEQQEQMQQIMENAREQHRAVRDNTHAKMAEILTPEQLQQLDERREKFRDRMKDGEGHHGKGKKRDCEEY